MHGWRRWPAAHVSVIQHHRASHAIMTCVVPSASNHEHVHFIDDGDGGFWQEAEGLKPQIQGVS